MAKKNKNKKRQQGQPQQASAAAAPKDAPKRRKLSDNPLLKQQRAFLNRLSDAERNSFFSESAVDTTRRAELWMEQADLGETLVNKYAWATPNERAIRILKEFSPILEVGCGANAYWCRQMKAAGIDIVGYDASPGQGGTIGGGDNDQSSSGSGSGAKQQTEFAVQQGGPEVLALPKNSKRTLFLCYPDESDVVLKVDADADDNDDEDSDDDDENGVPFSMGAACLGNYQGDYIIHVGELLGDANLSMEQAPWGRSSSPEFQEQLAAEYHCVLRVALPNWLHVRDSLSVWKRSKTCTIVFAADDDDGGEDDQEDEEVHYRHIPVEERLPADVAAPCLQHLLEDASSSSGPKKTTDAKTKEDVKTANKEATGTEESAGYECPW